MQGYKVISKGEGKAVKTNDLVNITNYVVAEKDGRRFLMLKCHNGRNQTVNGLTIRLNQFNAKKRMIQSDELTINDVQGGAGEEFVIENRIKLLSKCENVGIQLVHAQYGDYSYSPQEQGVSVDYAPDNRASRQRVMALKESMGNRKTVASESRLKAPVIISVLAILMVVALIGLLAFQIFSYKSNVVDFHYKNIQYSFKDGANEEGGDIIVTGYSGNASEIIIPEELDGHKVISIESFAFYYNSNIKKVVIEGSPKIKANAFAYCTRLATVDLGGVEYIGNEAFIGSGVESITSQNVVEVGNYAFAECLKLKEVNFSAPNENILKLGNFCFQNCPMLENVTFNSLTDYTEQGTLLGCTSLKNVKLYNFNIDCYSQEVQNFTLHNFVEVQSQIDTLEINKLGCMPNAFMQNFGVETFTARELEQTAIADDTFSGCTRLKTVNLPNAITSLGKNSFNGTLIEGFDLSQITLIDDYAFANCSALTYANLHENAILTTIGIGAFSGCSSLSSISIPKNISQIKNDLFNGCSSLENVNFAAGNNITNLGDRTFQNCTSLKQIDIPANVTYLSTSLFEGCTSLVGVEFPYMIEGVGYRSFADCTALSYIEFPQTLVSIDGYAFSGSGILSIEIPANIEYIGRGAFANCQKLQEYSSYFIGGGEVSNEFFGYVFGDDDYEVSESAVPQSLTKVAINGVTVIPYGAFYNCAYIEDVVFLNDITDISDLAFYGCESLKDINYPESLITIGEKAFYNCDGLTKIELSSTVEVEGGAYSGCDGLSEMIINFASEHAMNIFYLGYYFGGDATFVPSSIRKVTLNGDGNISANAFNSCANIQEVVLNGQITSIGNYAFYGCDMLQNIVLPEGLNDISTCAFANCRTLPFINIPSTVNFVSADAFQNTYNLYEVENLSTLNLTYTIPSALNIYGENGSPMQKIEYNGYTISFKNDTWYLTRYPVNQSNLQFPQYFEYPYEYSDVVVPSYVLANNLMRKNNRVTSLSIPSSVSKISEYCFEGCANLETVVFESGSDISEIPNYAFNACKLLSSVTLPQNVTRIGNYAFSQCALTTIDLPDSIYTIDLFAFYQNKLIELKLPYSLLEIGQCAFASNESLEDIEFNPLLIDIGEDAFSYNRLLTELNLPSSLQVIGNSAFRANSSLEVVNLPDYLTSIGAYAFNSCYKIKEIVLPRQLTSIGYGAFMGCSKLYEVYNLSSLDVQEGSTENGYVGYNAFAVYRSLNEASRVIYKDDFIFSLTSGVWKLRRIPAKMDLYTLLEPFTADGYNVNRYEISYDAFSEVVPYEIVIPTCVTFIDDEALMSLMNSYIYYCGNANQWNNIVNNNLFNQNVFYKTNCIHGENQWKYQEGEIYIDYYLDEDILRNPTCTVEGSKNITCRVCGEVVQTNVAIPTIAHDYQETVVVKPTCQKTGLANMACSVCGEVSQSNIVVDTIGHTKGSDGNCTVCGVTLVTNKNYQSLGLNYTNDSAYKFKIGTDEIYSVNKGSNSNSTFIITATANLELSFRIEVSSENNYDIFTARLNGTIIGAISGTNSMSFNYTLSAGDQLSFTYSKDDSGDQGLDRGMIKNLAVRTSK